MDKTCGTHKSTNAPRRRAWGVVLPFVVLPLLVAVVCIAGAHTALAADADWFYTVRPGDNLWTIARRFCRDKDCDREILVRNGLRRASDLHAGRAIAIPVRLLLRVPVAAHVASVNGTAFLERRTAPRQALKAGAVLQIDDHVITEAGSVTIVFADNSSLVLGDHGEIALDMLGAFGDTGMVDTQIRALRGRLEPQVVKHPPPGSSFRIATPTGTAVVRGTEFRIRAEGANYAELKTGKLDFDATHIDPGFGLVTRPNTPTPPAEALLPAAPPDSINVSASVPMHVRWAAIPGAMNYRVLLFRAVSPPELLSITSTTNAVAEIPATAGADYRVQIRGVAASGLEGLDATVQVHALPPPPLISAVSSTSGTLTLSWPTTADTPRYHLEIAHDTAFAKIEQQHTSETNSLSVDVPGGAHFWRVRGDGPAGPSDFSAPAALVVVPPPLTLKVTPRVWRRNITSLSWSTVKGALFRVQVANDARFTEVQQEWTTPLQTWDLNCERVTCYVRVRAEFETLQGDWATAATVSSGLLH